MVFKWKLLSLSPSFSHSTLLLSSLPTLCGKEKYSKAALFTLSNSVPIIIALAFLPFSFCNNNQQFWLSSDFFFFSPKRLYMWNGMEWNGRTCLYIFSFSFSSFESKLLLTLYRYYQFINSCCVYTLPYKYYNSISTFCALSVSFFPYTLHTL